MLRLLLQPFPFSTRTSRRLRTALGFGLFVFLFLFIFRPFGLNYLKNGPLALAAFLYGLVCSTVLLSWFLLLPLVFPRIFRESSWTVWKEICHTLVCTLAVCCGNIVFTHFYFHVAFSGGLVLDFLWRTFSVAILPIVLMVLLRQIRLMRTFSRQASELDRQLSARDNDPGPAAPPPPDGLGEFLYAEAADNYVKVFYQGEQKLIRSSLKQLEEELREHVRVFRCHRTYLVNLDKIVHISGNAQGYKLHIEGVEPVIPVSRSLNGEVARLVTRPKDPPIRPSDL